MKKLLLILLIPMIGCFNSEDSSKEFNPKDYFEDSQKKQKALGKLDIVEDLDTALNLYSNYKYHIAYDGPNNWIVDKGVSEDIIYRTYQKDSGIVFSIGIQEFKKELKEDIWTTYEKNKTEFDKTWFVIQKTLNIIPESIATEKAILRNYICLKRSCEFNVESVNMQYKSKYISYDVYRGHLQLTFSLNLPNMFFVLNPDYYNNLFKNISFTEDMSLINKPN